MINGNNPQILYVRKDLYDALERELAEAKSEIARLKDTPGGKRLYSVMKELAAERDKSSDLLQTYDNMFKLFQAEQEKSARLEAVHKHASEELGKLAVDNARLIEEIECLRSVLSEWEQDKSCYLQMNRANELRDARLLPGTGSDT